MTPSTAAARTRMVRQAVLDAGYQARVTSTPGSHRAQMTTVDKCCDPEAVAVYLAGYLQGLAEVRVAPGPFISVRW